MKQFFVCCTGFLLAATALIAQQRPVASPPETASVTIGGKTITIKYNSPRVKGREGHIFAKDGLISHDPHYPVWRAGANAATTLVTDGNLKIGDIEVPAGTYTLFVDISDPASWTLIVSKATGEWGLAYDASKDLGKTKMATAKPPAMVEELTWTLGASPDTLPLLGVGAGTSKGTLTLAWEDVTASVPFSVH